MTIPARYGYEGVNWLTRIELTYRPHTGYWEQRGWDIDAWLGTSNKHLIF